MSKPTKLIALHIFIGSLYFVHTSSDVTRIVDLKPEILGTTDAHVPEQTDGTTAVIWNGFEISDTTDMNGTRSKNMLYEQQKITQISNHSVLGPETHPEPEVFNQVKETDTKSGEDYNDRSSMNRNKTEVHSAKPLRSPVLEAVQERNATNKVDNWNTEAESDVDVTEYVSVTDQNQSVIVKPPQQHATSPGSELIEDAALEFVHQLTPVDTNPTKANETGSEMSLEQTNGTLNAPTEHIIKAEQEVGDATRDHWHQVSHKRLGEAQMNNDSWRSSNAYTTSVVSSRNAEVGEDVKTDIGPTGLEDVPGDSKLKKHLERSNWSETTASDSEQDGILYRANGTENVRMESTVERQIDQFEHDRKGRTESDQVNAEIGTSKNWSKSDYHKENSERLPEEPILEEGYHSAYWDQKKNQIRQMDNVTDKSIPVTQETLAVSKFEDGSTLGGGVSTESKHYTERIAINVNQTNDQGYTKESSITPSLQDRHVDRTDVSNPSDHSDVHIQTDDRKPKKNFDDEKDLSERLGWSTSHSPNNKEENEKKLPLKDEEFSVGRSTSVVLHDIGHLMEEDLSAPDTQVIDPNPNDYLLGPLPQISVSSESSSNDSKVTMPSELEKNTEGHYTAPIDLGCHLDSKTCPALVHVQGLKGHRGPEGVLGRQGEQGYCPPVECAVPEAIVQMGTRGLRGVCDARCPEISGPKGVQGPEGNRGADVVLDAASLRNVVVHVVDELASQLLPKVGSLTHHSGSRRIRKLRRRKRNHGWGFGESPHLLDKFSRMNTVSKRDALGVIIMKNPKELSTRGSQLPVGALIATYLETMDYNTSSLPAMGMFMKTDNKDNRWSRVPVAFEKEVIYTIPSPASVQPQHQRPERNIPSSLVQMVLAYYPKPFTGSEFLGWYGADALCRVAAEQRLGIPGFRVFLADQNLPLERILPWRLNRVPVINLAGAALFRDLKDFLYGMPPFANEPIYDLNGTPHMDDVQNKYFWFGAGRQYSCDYWSSNKSTDSGLVWTMERRLRRVRTGYSRCDTPNHFLCYKLMPRSTD